MHRLLLLAPLAMLGCSEYDLHSPGDTPGTPDEEEPPVTSGPQPDIQLSTNMLTFGWSPIDCPTDPKEVTITNVGDADLVVSDIFLSGDGYDNFRLTASAVTLAPGASSEFRVVFDPNTYAEFDPAVIVASNDPDESEAIVDLLGTGSESAMMEEYFEQPSPEAVDVLWVVDNSCSMGEEVEHLQDSFREFINSFIDLGLDYHIATVSTDVITDGQKGLFQGSLKVIDSTLSKSEAEAAFLDQTDLGSGGSADEQGFEAAQLALSEPLISGANSGFLRDDALLSVVALSDEDDASPSSAADFASWFEAYKGNPATTNFSAIVGPDGGLMGCQNWDTFPPTQASPAPKYHEATRRTGGEAFDICTLDFDQVLSYLGYSAAGLLTRFELSQRPVNFGQIEVVVDGTKLNYGYPRWVYDTTDNAVVFFPESIPAPEAQVFIRYPVPSDCN